jgi:hypothetical protein
MYVVCSGILSERVFWKFQHEATHVDRKVYLVLLDRTLVEHLTSATLPQTNVP